MVKKKLKVETEHTKLLFLRNMPSAKEDMIAAYVVCCFIKKGG
jgi:hypothetical protein